METDSTKSLSKRERAILSRVKKAQTIDTSALISDPEMLRELDDGENLIVVPWVVFDELDVFKHRKEGPKKRARQAQKIIDEMSSSPDSNLVFLNPNWEGITGNGIRPKQILKKQKDDDQIIATALTALKRYGLPTHLISHDLYMRGKARQFVQVEGREATQCLIIDEWEQDKGDPPETLAPPVIPISRNLIKDKSLKGVIPLSEINLDEFSLFNNMIVFVKQVGMEGYGQITHAGIVEGKNIVLIDQDINLLGFVKQREIKDNGSFLTNWWQIATIKMLKTSKSPYISLVGAPGSGKTFLAMLSSFELMMDSNSPYKRLYITRAPVPFGKTLGFTPGTVEEKMSHWVESMYDNIRAILNNPHCSEAHKKKIKMFVFGDSGEKSNKDDKEERRDRRKVHILPLEYIRGRSIPDSIILVDETQNLDKAEVETIGTRLGDNSRMIFAGDPTQRDLPYLTETRNGLMWFSRVMKGSENFSYSYLPYSVRHPAVQELIRRIGKSKKNEE